jgi:thiopurine S-methyltransferase
VLDITPQQLGRFDLVYDRAALVALAPSTRARYAGVSQAMLAEDGVIFLIAFAYDQTKTPGPPWSVPAEAVRELYAGMEIEELSTRSVPTSPRLTKAGLLALEETAYRIGR